MATTPIERLMRLRHELEGLPADPWTNIESWIANASPVIRRDWSDYLDDFHQISKTPRWKIHVGAMVADHEETKADRANRAIAIGGKDKLLRFIDGLLSIAELPPAMPEQHSPGQGKMARKPGLKKKTKGQARSRIDRRKVFVVHGRNHTAREALFTFLRSVGLHPLEWSEIVTATGKASPYIGEVLERGFSIAQAIVVLMTPDDEARLRKPYRDSTEPPYETDLTPQPRPNVLLEAGMALGLFPNRTVIVELGQLRPVSDIGGRHVVHMNDTPEKRSELAQRLETAGCSVNRTGTDWYKAGTFVNPL